MHAREVTRRHAGLPGTSREHHSTHDTPQDTRHTPRGQHAMAGVSFLGRKVYFRVGEPEGRRVLRVVRTYGKHTTQSHHDCPLTCGVAVQARRPLLTRDVPKRVSRWAPRGDLLGAHRATRSIWK